MNRLAQITAALFGRKQIANQAWVISAPLFESLEGRQLFSTYMVTDRADHGTGSLRQAIVQANAHPGADTIKFAAGLHGTVTLTSGELLVTDSVSIAGPGASHLTINGNHLFRAFYMGTPSASVSVGGLTIANGLSIPGFGGGIENFSNLTLSNVVFYKNVSGSHATTGGVGGGGGGLMNYGHVYMNNCTFDHNQSQESDLENYGGAAIFNEGSMTITHTTISNNESLLSSSVTIPHSGEDGGTAGIYNEGSLRATDDTIAYNIAGGGSGGGLWNAGNATVVDCTIAHNSGGFVSGGIVNDGTLTLGNSVVALNTYIANHGASPDFDATVGMFIDLGHNLFGLNPAGTLAGTDLHGSFSVILNPDLGPLAFNGGPTETMAITTSSPAYHHGSRSLAIFYGLTTDQRGVARYTPTVSDIGAFEK